VLRVWGYKGGLLQDTLCVPTGSSTVLHVYCMCIA
jgi:hypothetical protein